eukprot:4294-Heterococcus_DN1.PRE.1
MKRRPIDYVPTATLGSCCGRVPCCKSCKLKQSELKLNFSGRVTRHRVLAAMERRAGRLSVHRVIRLISWESFDANLLKPASFSSRSRFIIATWANSANSSGLWFLPYFRSLHKWFSHSCNWRGFRVDL